MRIAKIIFTVVITLLILIILFIRSNRLMIRIEGPGMEPYIKNKSLALVNKFSDNYKEGDIVLLKSHNRLSPNLQWIAKIVNVKIDTVEIEVGSYSQHPKNLGEISKSYIIGKIYSLSK